MLSFASSLSPDSDAFAIFVTEKYEYRDKRKKLKLIEGVLEKTDQYLPHLAL